MGILSEVKSAVGLKVKKRMSGPRSLKDIREKMKNLDYCMMTTVTGHGLPVGRPMSNNKDVQYKGDSFFFTWDDSKLGNDLKKNKKVNLAFMGAKRLFISVAGQAKLIKDVEQMKEHWDPSLNMWFKDGVETDGVVMIHVKAQRIKYWQDAESGEHVFKR